MLPLPPVTGLELGGAAVADDVPLAPLTTLRIGPVARRLITCTSTEQVVGALRATDAGSSPACGRVLVLAGGSNVVLADDLADLTVVLLANTEISVEGNIVRNAGLYGVNVRGLHKTGAVALWHALAHNVSRLIRLGIPWPAPA